MVSRDGGKASSTSPKAFVDVYENDYTLVKEIIRIQDDSTNSFMLTSRFGYSLIT